MAIARERQAGKTLVWVAAVSVLLILFIFLVMNRLTVLQPPPMAAVRAVKNEQPPRVSISGRDLDVRVVLRSLADQIGSHLVLDEAVHGKLSINAREADFNDLMENLCTAFHCSWKLEQNSTLTLRITRQTGS